jgi:hypothetical protein
MSFYSIDICSQFSPVLKDNSPERSKMIRLKKIYAVVKVE